MKLSRTNYGYTPIITAGPDKRQEIFQNFFAGERKQQLYGVMIESMRQAWKLMDEDEGIM